MSSDPDTARILRSWLDEGVTQLPDRVLDDVLDRVPTTPQHRAGWWPRRTQPEMNAFATVGVAAAVVVAALVGFSLLFASNIGGPWVDDPSPTPTATASPTPTPTEGAWTSFAPLEEGRNALVSGDVRFSIEVPPGWRTTEYEGMIDYSLPSGGHWPWIGFLWTFDSVADDPCAASAMPVGPSVDDLASALTTIPGTDATQPEDTTIGGIPARFVELTIDEDIGCEPNSFWLYGPDSAWPNSVSSTIRIWVFDLDGTRYVIHSDQIGGDPDRIVDIVESIEFEQP